MRKILLGIFFPLITGTAFAQYSPYFFNYNGFLSIDKNTTEINPFPTVIFPFYLSKPSPSYTDQSIERAIAYAAVDREASFAKTNLEKLKLQHPVLEQELANIIRSHDFFVTRVATTKNYKELLARLHQLYFNVEQLAQKDASCALKVKLILNHQYRYGSTGIAPLGKIHNFRKMLAEKYNFTSDFYKAKKQDGTSVVIRISPQEHQNMDLFFADFL